MPRLYISAAHKSSGKTIVTLGLVSAFAQRGLDVRTFKKGPDYIDPLWHARASGRPCYNLDFNTQTLREILATLTTRSTGADIAVIEGNKGLHDGVDLEGRDSNAAMAKLTRSPVVLVIDAFGLARGVAALLRGFVEFDRRVRIGGVILNRTGPERQVAKMRQAIERYTDVPVLGAIGRSEALAVRERHLGLTTPSETSAAQTLMAAARDAVRAGVDLDRLLELGSQAADLPLVAAPARRSTGSKVRIAIARDAAFGFYYADDLEALEANGAELAFFDALSDARLPPCDGLFIGGGFPETHADCLEANVALRADIGEKIAAGLPTYAECGGLMYLSRSIEWNGVRREMVGAIPGDTYMGTRPQGRGLVRLQERAGLWGRSPTRPIPAHEFHYARLENLPEEVEFAYDMRRGYGVDGSRDGIRIGSMLASFTHLRDTSRHRWTHRFVEFVRRRRDEARAPSAKSPSRIDLRTRPGSTSVDVDASRPR